MARCALIAVDTNLVTNLIVADPAVDLPPEGFLIVVLPDNSPVSFGWVYDPETGEITSPST